MRPARDFLFIQLSNIREDVDFSEDNSYLGA